MTNVEIAVELFLSEETVKIHVRNLMRKLPIESRAEVTAWMESFTAATTA
jgi:two-component system nitrate/nitrite response regulator NarP